MNQCWASSLNPVVTSGNTYGGKSDNLIDGNVETYSCFSKNGWFQIELPSLVVPFFMKIQSQRYNDGWASNGPMFYIDSSNDTITWKRLRTVTSNPNLGGEGKNTILQLDNNFPARYIKYTNNGGNVCAVEIDYFFLLNIKTTNNICLTLLVQNISLAFIASIV